MAADDLVELRFRLEDGTDIGPNKFSQSTTVASLKENIIAQWPEGKENAPKTIDDVKLINAGRILENNRTLQEEWSRGSESKLPGMVITMHVVLRSFIADKKSEKLQNDPPTNRCSCTIL